MIIVYLLFKMRFRFIAFACFGTKLVLCTIVVSLWIYMYTIYIWSELSIGKYISIISMFYTKFKKIIRNWDNNYYQELHIQLILFLKLFL